MDKFGKANVQEKFSFAQFKWPYHFADSFPLSSELHDELCWFDQFVFGISLTGIHRKISTNQASLQATRSQLKGRDRKRVTRCRTSD